MNAPNHRLTDLRPNPDWAKLPLFERKGWRRYRFDQIAENIRESVMPTPDDSAMYIGLEHLDSGSLHIRRWGSQTDLIGQKLRMRKGDILFARRNAYLRRVAIAPHDGLFSAHGMILRAKSNVALPEFLPFLMMSERFMSRAETISVGSLSPTINWSTLKLEEFDLPPLEQQRGIAEVLALGYEVVKRYALLIASLVENRQAQIDDLIPAPAESTLDQAFIRLDQVASMQNGRPFPSSKYQDRGVRLIRPGNLAPDGTLDWSSNVTVCLPEEFRLENGDWFIDSNQVLINLTAQSLEDGFMGRVCITGEQDGGLLNQRIGRFVLGKDVVPKFFFRCLQTTRFRKVVENRCEGSKIRHLYFRHFEDFQLPSFTLKHQKEVVERLDAVDEAIRAVENHRIGVRALHHSLTGALT